MSLHSPAPAGHGWHRWAVFEFRKTLISPLHDGHGLYVRPRYRREVRAISTHKTKVAAVNRSGAGQGVCLSRFIRAPKLGAWAVVG